MKKRILPALLALCMVMSLLPVTVFAAASDMENCLAGCTKEGDVYTHAAGCPNAPCEDDDCKNNTEHTVGSSSHTWQCTCTGTGCKRATPCTQRCTEEVANQTAAAKATVKCTTCTTAVCVNATEEGVCEAETHNAGCIEKCTKAADCPATGAHKANCLKAAAIEANTHTEKVEITLTCACTKNTAHDHANPCAAEITVTAEVTYVVEPAGETATEDEIATAKATAVNAKKVALQAENPLCDDCKAAEVDACTGTADCTAQAHKKDCLSKCTMDGNCKNSVGVASAHKVTYTLKYELTTYTRTDGTVTSATGDETTVSGLADYAAVQAKLDEIVTITELEAPSEEGGNGVVRKSAAYTVIAVHCDMAKAANDVTLGTVEDDETTEPTDPTTPDEPKAPTKAEEFDDLKGDEWYAEDLTALIEKGVFTGSLDDGKYSFNATGNVTGAEMVVLLSRVAGEDLVTTGAGWNLAATEWAAEAGYTEGLEINTTGKLTRKDVVLVLWRVAGKPESEQELSFTDAEGLEGDYLTAMKWAVEKKVIGGYEDNTVKPDGDITRAEMVTVLTRYSNVK